MALDKIRTELIADDAITSDQLGVGAIAGSDIAADVIEVKSHIKPGVLQPAVAGKLLDGSTSHSGAYGTAQNDGHSYYYTDIKGSKPIKDPRIGAYFGSQRHLLSSAQLQTDETSDQGANVYRFEGREWVRGSGTFGLQNDGNGVQYEMSGNATFIEITGYFSDANIQALQYSSLRHFTWSVDGGSGTTNTNFRNTNLGPLAGRFVNGAGWQNIGLGATLGIHTLKILNKDSGTTAQDFRPYAFELIAQDTTSTATKSKIQIPAQNVISYGKKFSISAATPHYDPFNGMSGAKTLSQLGDYIDTATSLGMDNWKGGTSNYYKPWNGGRVVKWVASDGTIKTSVTMMPPNAQNISTTASNAVSDAHIQAGTNDDPINFDTTTIANATPLHEVAKTFMAQEFGNGAANTGGGNNWADASMLNHDGTADDIAYVMDDGLTGVNGDNTIISNHAIMPNADDDFTFHLFIGTGISINDPLGDAPGQYTPAQNLPYGTHLLKSIRKSGTNAVEFIVDGISFGTVSNCTKGRCEEVTFYQPKKPPVPEDSCILADYMLMADFVAIATQGSNDAYLTRVSKGTRWVSASRDWFYKDTDGEDYVLDQPTPNALGGFYTYINGTCDSDTSAQAKLPCFGTNFISRGYDAENRHRLYVNDSAKSRTDMTGAYQATGTRLATDEVLGVHTFQSHGTQGQNHNFNGCEIVTPIHTSSHYQTFETTNYNELVGGDRNMEQNNLVVTSDGKTWDEVTRDTSYLSPNFKVRCHRDGGSYTTEAIFTQDLFRGKVQYSNENMTMKDFSISQGRIVCLKDGRYRLNAQMTEHSNNSAAYWYFRINGAQVGLISKGAGTSTRIFSMNGEQTLDLKRKDYIQIMAYYVKGDDVRDNTLTIVKAD